VTSFIHYARQIILPRAAAHPFLLFTLVLICMAIFLVLPRSTDASAQNVCFERAALIKHLSGKFEEAPVAAGLAANGSMVEVFSSPDGNTWTIVLTQPDGATCVMASGESWIGVKPLKKGKIS
tara:strand:- start:1137 stop:1505 length:369 start_codon:yes stop_codon:yes gene_type:complete